MRFNYETVGPQYFQTMRIPLVQGRDIKERDGENGRRVVVINQTMARRFWPGGAALGRRLKLANDWLEIVGVAKDVKNRSLSERPAPFLYVPLLQDYRSNMILVARTTIEPEATVHAVQAAVASLDLGMPVFDIRTFEEHIGIALFLQRMAAMLLSLFGLLALALSAIGLYGVMAFTVSQRIRELGIRIAIGAQQGDVLRLILGQALALSAIGIIGGLIIAAMSTRLAAHLLYGVSATDPVTFTVIGLLLLLVASLAGYLPARRATRVDPIIALRVE
jgi:predicted permease